MDSVCAASGGAHKDPSTCVCEPATPLPGVALEHLTIGAVQLLNASYLFLFIRWQRRRVVAAASAASPREMESQRASLLGGGREEARGGSFGPFARREERSGRSGGRSSRMAKSITRGGGGGGSRLLVLPVYAKLLVFEAWQCVGWGVFFLHQAYADFYGASDAMATLQFLRYACSFSWAVCAEGIFIFLTLASAGAESLHLAVRAAAVWACALLVGSALLWTRWAS